MDRIRGLFNKKSAAEQDYDPLVEQEPLVADQSSSFLEAESESEAIFSWTEYSIFALLGVAMLWAW
jgi:solute carrier family 29 (equilibrative nucleoside transporter), member 1/2/3